MKDEIRSNDLAAVRARLTLHPELAHGGDAIRLATMARLPEMGRLLLDFGANPRDGVYPLAEATSALGIATDREYHEITDIILAGNEAKPDPSDSLRLALRARDEDAAIALLTLHPEMIRFEAPGHRSLRELAIELSLPRLRDWLPEERSGAAMLRLSVMEGNIAALRDEHSRQDIVTPRDDQGWLLRVAVDHNRAEVLAALLDMGLDADARVGGEFDSWGMPLYECVRAGQHEMAEMLLARGADPNGMVYAGGTPLSEAYGQRDEQMIALLVRFGGRPNASMAGLYRRLDLAQQLLAEHGDTVLPDDGFSSGTVAEQLVGGAARGGAADVMRLGLGRVNWPAGDRRWYGGLDGALRFWNHGQGPWCHHEWDRSSYLECFRMILQRLGPPVFAPRLSVTVLHRIASMAAHVTGAECAAFAAAAIEAGALIHVRNEVLCSTPLGWACRWGRLAMVRLLLERGADPVERDAEPWASPAAWARKKGHAEIQELLRLSGQR